MSFLKKLGNVINAASPLIPVVGPLVGALVPKSAPAVNAIDRELSAIAADVIKMEAIGQQMQLPGAKKLELVAPLVAQIVLQSSLMQGRAVKDQALFLKGVTSIASGVADCLNAVEETRVS